MPVDTLKLPNRWLTGLMGPTGPFWINASEVKAVECQDDGSVSLLMDDGRCYVSTDNVGVVLLSLGGKRPLGADDGRATGDADAPG